MYFHFRSMRISFISNVTSVHKATTLAKDTNLWIPILVVVPGFHPGRPGWNLPYERTTKFVSVTEPSPVTVKRPFETARMDENRQPWKTGTINKSRLHSYEETRKFKMASGNPLLTLERMLNGRTTLKTQKVTHNNIVCKYKIYRLRFPSKDMLLVLNSSAWSLCYVLELDFSSSVCIKATY